MLLNKSIFFYYNYDVYKEKEIASKRYKMLGIGFGFIDEMKRQNQKGIGSVCAWQYFKVQISIILLAA